MRKIKELILSSENIEQPNLTLKTVSDKIFEYSFNTNFVLSTEPPEERYEIPVNLDSQRIVNMNVNNFNSLGPNEKYLINHIFYSSDPLMFLIGGIGVGKSHFCNFFTSKVLPNIEHSPSQNKFFCPFIIYFNFNDFGKNEDSDYAISKKRVLMEINNRINSTIYAKNIFNSDEEVTDVWENVLKFYNKSLNKNSAVDFLINELHREKAGSERLETNRLATIKKRKQIRDRIEKDCELYRTYLALLLGYMRRTVFKGHENCMILIIDNLDQEISMIQKIVTQNVYIIARVSGIRVIVPLRQTTYFQQVNYSSNLQECPNRVAYCGATPLQVVQSRLDNFLKNDTIDLPISTEEVISLKSGVEIIYNVLNADNRLKFFYKNLCGRSVRKGIEIARNLIFNPIYDIYNLKPNEISQFRIQRALIIGGQSEYTWSHNNFVENIYQVQHSRFPLYFIKLRILKAIKNTNVSHIRLHYLIDILTAFGYLPDQITYAIDELKDQNKRLIWSDSVRGFFELPDNLFKFGSSILYISTIGEGYEVQMFKSYTYLREIIRDTLVDEELFGSGWKEEKVTQTLFLVWKFITSILIPQDIEETKLFVRDMGVGYYEKCFGTRKLLSTDIVTSVNKSIERICFVNMEIEEGKSKKNLIKFLKEHKAFYNERHDWIIHNEKEIFG